MASKAIAGNRLWVRIPPAASLAGIPAAAVADTRIETRWRHNPTVPLRETIEALASFGPRLAGSDGDRKATEYLAKRLGELDRKVEVDEISVRPNQYLVHAAYLLLAIAGILVSTASPPVGTLIVLAAAASMYLDLSGRFYVLRSLLPRRKTRNLTLRGANGDAPTCVVITAHHDSGRTGLLYSLAVTRLFGRLNRIAGPIDLAFWTVCLALVLACMRLLLGEPSVVTVMQLIAAILLLAQALLLADTAFSASSPGASSNASGVAAALELADRLRSSPPTRLDVWIVLTGAGEAPMLGMQHWLRKRVSQLRRRMHLFVNLDTLGQGTPRYAVAEGVAGVHPHDPYLIDQCRQLGPSFNAKPAVLRRATDGLPPAMSGYPSITICALDEHERAPRFHHESDTADHVDIASVELATDFAEALIRKLDAKAPSADKRRKRGRRKRTTREGAGRQR
jgi:hypothetical protein